MSTSGRSTEPAASSESHGPQFTHGTPPHEEDVDKIARAVLYEGYVLYPYRPSVKTRQRWTFGGLFPETYTAHRATGDRALMQAQCLLEGGLLSRISIRLRFLHVTERHVERAPGFDRVETLRVGEQDYARWQEAVEREVVVSHLGLAQLAGEPVRQAFSFPADRAVELLAEGRRTVGRLVRERQAVEGNIEISARCLDAAIYELTVRVTNTTPLDQAAERDAAQLRAFASTHLIIRATAAECFSLTDPPKKAAEAAARCENIGCWPVLAGKAGRTDTLLMSPIILPDYPEIAPESPGDLFDGCEIDEILTLRILTLTDAEKRQAAGVDDRVRQLMQRTETLARDQLMNLHGVLRNVDAGPPAAIGEGRDA